MAPISNAPKTIKFVFWLLFSALSIHLLLYTATTANPYLRSDGWFFVSDFIMPFYNGDFSFSDLYILRNDSDHAQPLHRILLFINAALFDMDFRYEAIFGAFFAVLLAGMICVHFKNSHKLKVLPKDVAVGLLALVMLMYSFNSTITYTWSLSTLGFLPLFINVAFFIYLSNSIVKNSGSTLALMIAGAFMLFVGDNSSVIAMVAAGIVVLIAGIILKQRYALKCLASIVLMLIVYKIFRSYMVGDVPVSGKNSNFLDNLGYYFKNWDIIYKVLVAPFSDSFIHIMHLRAFPEIKNEFSFFLGCSLIFMHLYAWYGFFKYKLHEKSYLPIILMLYSYLFIAGIAFYRVPIFGHEYLHQPRYVREYQIGLWGSILALLSMYCVKNEMNKAMVARKVLYLAVVIVVGAQSILINKAWESRKHVIAWQNNHAKKILYYSSYTAEGKPCTKGKASFPICRMEKSRRERLVGFLEDNKLNVFSERIRGDYLN